MREKNYWVNGSTGLMQEKAAWGEEVELVQDIFVVRARKATVARNEKGTDNGAKLCSSVPPGIEFSDLYSLFQLILITTLSSRNCEETEAHSSHICSLATEEPRFKLRTNSKVYLLCIQCWPNTRKWCQQN